jgi:hypothetical protein
MKKSLSLVLCVLIAAVFAGTTLAENPPTSFTEMQSASSSLRPEAEKRQTNTSQLAALTFYTSRAAFDAIVPGIPTENFESGLVAPGGVVICLVDPISSANGGSCFPSGALLSGFSYGTAGGTGFVILGSGVVGNPSVVLGADQFAENATLTFSNPDVLAVGFDLLEPLGTAVTISVFSAGGLEGQTIVPVGGGFFGVTSDTTITAIEVGTAGPFAGEVIDNLSFGEGCPCPAANSLFADFVNGLVPIMTLIECRDNADSTGIFVVRTDGSLAGAASGTRNGGPPMCGTQVNYAHSDFITITPGEDAACRSLLRTVCPE